VLSKKPSCPSSWSWLQTENDDVLVKQYSSVEEVARVRVRE
jgi:hypothetical protein